MSTKSTRRMPRSKLLQKVKEDREPETAPPDERPPSVDAEAANTSAQQDVRMYEHMPDSTPGRPDASSTDPQPVVAAEPPLRQASKPPSEQSLAAPTPGGPPPDPRDLPETSHGRQRPALSATWSRTTVLIEPSVFKSLRFRAVVEDRTLSEIITDALRQYLEQH